MSHRTQPSKLLSVQGVASKSQAARNKLVKKAALFVLVLTMSVLFCVWSRVRIVQIGYEVTKLQKDASELSKKVNHLKIETERLKSPGHLQKVATEVLRMHSPGSNEIVFVKKVRNR